MSLHIQHVEGEYRVVMTREEFEALQIPDGAAVRIVVEEDQTGENGATPQRRGVQYASLDEVMEAHRATEPMFENAYRELAK